MLWPPCVRRGAWLGQALGPRVGNGELLPPVGIIRGSPLTVTGPHRQSYPRPRAAALPSSVRVHSTPTVPRSASANISSAGLGLPRGLTRLSLVHTLPGLFVSGGDGSDPRALALQVTPRVRQQHVADMGDWERGRSSSSILKKNKQQNQQKKGECVCLYSISEIILPYL